MLRDLHPQPPCPGADLSPGQEVPSCGTDSQVPGAPPGWLGFLRAGTRQQLWELGQSRPFPGRRHLGLLRGRVPALSLSPVSPELPLVLWTEPAAGSLGALPSVSSPPFVRGPASLFSPGSQGLRLHFREGAASSAGRVKAQEAAGQGPSVKVGSCRHPELHGTPGISECECACFFLGSPLPSKDLDTTKGTVKMRRFPVP